LSLWTHLSTHSGSRMGPKQRPWTHAVLPLQAPRAARMQCHRLNLTRSKRLEAHWR
jgi:hypothetical protein